MHPAVCVSLHVCMCLEERPADLSRKARPGSAEMSGCYGERVNREVSYGERETREGGVGVWWVSV